MSELEREGELPTNDIFETKFQRGGLPTTPKTNTPKPEINYRTLYLARGL